MSRNFIFNARKQGDSARNLNLRCGLGASKRGFGAQRALGAYGHGHLPGAKCDDLGIRGREFLRSIRCRDVGAGGHRLLRDTKCYDFVACIDRLFRDIGCCDLSASEYSLSQDIGRRGFIAPKYELCSRVNCDYSESVLLNGAVRYGFAARNLALLRGDTYRGSSASTYLRCSSSAGACLQRVGANLDVHSRRDPSASARLRRSSNANDRLQRVSDYPARAACLHCRFGANPDARLRYGFGADYFKNSGGISTRNFKIYALDFARNFKDFTWSLGAKLTRNFKISASNFTRNFKNSVRSLEAEPVQSFKNQNSAHDFLQSAKSYDQNSTHGFSQSGRSAEPNSKPSFSQNIKNSERNFPLSFLQSAKNSDQSQNSKPASAQSHADPNSAQNFLQSAKNSDPRKTKQIQFRRRSSKIPSRAWRSSKSWVFTRLNLKTSARGIFSPIRCAPSFFAPAFLRCRARLAF